MILCGKSSCNYCEEVFDFKNKFHNYIRSHECQKFLSRLVTIFISAIKSLPFHDFNLSSLFIFETIFNDANTAIKKREITRFVATSASAAKSIMFYKSSLSAFVFVKTSTSLSAYRFVSSPSFIYESYKKSYLMVADLYIRYALLSKPSFNKITRIIIMLFIMFMQNLYEKFYNKEKSISFTSSKTIK